MIPTWVVKLLEQAKADAWTGSITIVYRSGDPRHAKREDVIQAPEPVQGRVIAPACPNGCASPMAERDYGNLYVCASCGTKRTRAQMQNLPRRADG